MQQMMTDLRGRLRKALGIVGASAGPTHLNVEGGLIPVIDFAPFLARTQAQKVQFAVGMAAGLNGYSTTQVAVPRDSIIRQVDIAGSGVAEPTVILVEARILGTSTAGGGTGEYFSYGPAPMPVAQNVASPITFVSAERIGVILNRFNLPMFVPAGGFVELRVGTTGASAGTFVARFEGWILRPSMEGVHFPAVG